MPTEYFWSSCDRFGTGGDFLTCPPTRSIIRWLPPSCEARLMIISMRSQVLTSVVLLTLASVSPALAQKVTTVPDLTGKQVLEQMANQATGGVAGTAIAAATATEIATAP